MDEIVALLKKKRNYRKHRAMVRVHFSEETMAESVASCLRGLQALATPRGVTDAYLFFTRNEIDEIRTADLSRSLLS